MAIARRSRGRFQPLSLEGASTMLQKLTLLCILAAVCFSALAFPFRLPDPLFLRIENIPPTAGWWPWLYHTQLRSALLYTHSPLVYKESIAQGFLLAAAVAFLIVMVLRALGTVAPPVPWSTRLRGWMQNPVAWSVLLLCYLGATVLASPTFHYSLRNLFAFALGLLVPVALYSYRPGNYFLNKFMVLVLGCGSIVGLIALLQHLGLTRNFLPGYDDPRNRMSSLIGHNTGLSSWLMFPLSFAIYYAQTARRRWFRWGAVSHVLLFGFVILAAQSRAIWVLAALIVAVSFIWHFRVHGRRVTRRMVVIGACCLLGLIALQTVAPSVNPFARTPMSFFERMRKDVLNPQQLLRETRLRIMAVSLAELVPAKPLFGTGFGTFQWVYPPAQGRYFQKRIENTNLGFTTKRTDLAHNDYLQLLVESGLVGVALMAVPTILLLRSCRRAYLSASSIRAKARLVALAAPLAAVAIHAVVDFPFHVVPIALIAAACLGLLASQGAPEPSPIAEPDPSSVTSGKDADSSGIRWRPVLLCAVLLFSTFWVPLSSRDLIYREFVSDIYTSDASNWLRSFRRVPASNPEQQVYMLDRARPLFRRAIQLNVFNGAAYEGQASLLASRGNLFYSMSRKALREEDRNLADQYSTVARGDLELTINTAKNQVKNGELFYHFTYYLIGTAYRTLWYLNPNPTDQRQLNYLKSARTAFEAAVDTNIADTASLTSLVDIVNSGPLLDVAAATRYMGLIFRIDEELGRRSYLEPAVTLAAEGSAAAAMERLQKLDVQLAENPLLPISYAWSYFYASVWLPAELDRYEVVAEQTREWRQGRLAGGEPYMAKAGEQAREERHLGEVELLKAHYAAAKLDFQTAQVLASPLAEMDVRAEVLRDIAHEELTSTTKEYRPDPSYHRNKGVYSVYLRHGEAKKAGGFTLAVGAASQIKLEMKEALRALHFFKASNWSDFITLFLRDLRKTFPGDPRLDAYETGPAAATPAVGATNP